MAVNFSAKQFYARGMIKTVESALNASDVTP